MERFWFLVIGLGLDKMAVEALTRHSLGTAWALINSDEALRLPGGVKVERSERLKGLKGY